ncbi:MAG: hypothetical protein V2B14_00260 [bacterium]
MITLDTDLIQSLMLNSGFSGLNIAALSENQNQEEIPEIKELNNNGDLDFNEILKDLKLHNPNNRLAVLSLLKHSELLQIARLLEKDKLVIGLKFFTLPKLLKFIQQLPMDELVKILLQVFSKSEVLTLLPMKELMKFLDSSKINYGDLSKILQTLPNHLLAQILESIKGESVGNKSNEELIKELGAFKQNLLIEGLKSLPYKELLSIISKLIENNNDLFNEFSKESLLETIGRSHKLSLVEGMKALDPELIIKMLDELPNSLLSQVLVLLDYNKLSEVLQTYQPDLLAALASG